MKRSLSRSVFTAMRPRAGRALARVRACCDPVRIWVLCASGLAFSGQALAQVTADPDAVLNEVKDFLGDAFDVGIWILVGGGYLVAGYMIIVGAYKFFTDRDGGLAQFLVGIAVALGMVIIMTFFVTTAETELGKL